MKRNLKISGLGIEIYNRDFIGIGWDLANRMAEKLEDGWRLPSLSEMHIIKSIHDIRGIGNFPSKTVNNPLYWTSREGMTDYAYSFNIRTGTISIYKKSAEFRVRYIRNI